MNFEELLFQAKHNNPKAIEQIVNMFRPLIIKNSLVNGVFDEDLYQELNIEILKSIKCFEIIN